MTLWRVRKQLSFLNVMYETTHRIIPVLWWKKKRTYGKLHLGMTLNKSTSYSLNSFGHLLFLSHCHFKSIHSPRLFSWPPTRFNQMTNGHVHLEETRIVRLQGQNLQQNWIIKPISALNPPPKKSKTSIRYCRGWVLVW